MKFKSAVIGSFSALALLSGTWFACTLLYNAGRVEAQAAESAPKAGDRKGGRCYNGTFWSTCEVAPQAEDPMTVFATRTWHLAYLAGLIGYQPVRVDVIETAGACIYISRSYTAAGHQQTVMPKTALRSGVGCQ